MKRQRSGAIIQINSKSGKKGSFKNSAYAASKFGGIGLTQSIALELAEHGVRVNAICPGNLLDSPLWTRPMRSSSSMPRNQGITEEQVRQKYIDQVPMKRGCTYDDVCNVVVFLASDQSELHDRPGDQRDRRAGDALRPSRPAEALGHLDSIHDEGLHRPMGPFSSTAAQSEASFGFSKSTHNLAAFSSSSTST